MDGIGGGLRRRRTAAWMAVLMVGWPHAADARVTAPAGASVFRLDGGGVTYAMGVDARGYLQPLHWARRWRRAIRWRRGPRTNCPASTPPDR